MTMTLPSSEISDNALLNMMQQQAVETVQGPLLVLAGAGTGKTRVLTTRVAHLLLSRFAFPSQILAVTFTNKAAKEMTERIAALVPEARSGLWLGTFHSVAARILRRHAALLHLPENFTIIDIDDQLRLLKSLMLAAHFDDKKYPPKVVGGIIQRWKDQGYTPDKVPTPEGYDPLQQRIVPLYKAYQQRLQALGSVDFGDLLLYNVQLFTLHPEVLQEYQQRFRYILVDEYQDTNIVQYLWLRLLAQGHKNICCVGDDDQSIYGWRGAEVGNILKFEQDFPGATVIRLEQNYRSTLHILGAASQLIAHNHKRLGKVLWTEAEEGEKVQVLSFWDDREEARYVAGEIVRLQQQAASSLNNIAILVRAGFQTRPFEECFMNVAIPYRVVGNLRFYERQEIKDVIAYMRVISQLEDDLALERIINTPKRSIGETTLQLASHYGREHQLPLWQALHQLAEQNALKRANAVVQKFLSALMRWHHLLDHQDYKEVVQIVLEESGYLAMWQQEQSQEAQGRLENIKELLRALEEFPTLTSFLEHISLVTDNESMANEAMVTLMTLHAAKGLEFDSVFLPGWEEGVFPHQRALDEKEIVGLEEERRLAYVGLTRARKRAYVSYVTHRRIYNQWQNSIPSRFIDELPAEHCTWQYGNAVMQTLQEQKSPSAYSSKSPLFAATDTPVKNAAFSIGDKVFHEKFGTGYIGTLSGVTAEVHFTKAGTKKLMLSFLKKIS